MTAWTDDDLEAVLATVGADLDVGPTSLDAAAIAALVEGAGSVEEARPLEPAERKERDGGDEAGEEHSAPVAPVVPLADRASLRDQPPGGSGRTGRPGWAVAAVAAALVLVAGVAAVAPAREAVADFLGIGSTTIERTDGDPTESGGSDTEVGELRDPAASGQSAEAGDLREAARNVLADDLSELDRSEAEAMLGRSLPVPDGLEPVLLATPPEGGVVQVFADGSTLWVKAGTGELFTKQASSSQLEFVDGLGEEALAISGAHDLTTPGRVLRASSVVLWVDDDLELRLEGDANNTLSLEELINRARSVK